MSGGDQRGGVGRTKDLVALADGFCETYQHVADELGYTNRGTVHRIVTLALRDREADTIDDLHALELDRLDALQTAYWSPAMDGDLTAVSIVLRIIDRRSRLLGLLSPPHRQAMESPSEPRVIDPADLVACPTLPANTLAGQDGCEAAGC